MKTPPVACCSIISLPIWATPAIQYMHFERCWLSWFTFAGRKKTSSTRYQFYTKATQSAMSPLQRTKSWNASHSFSAFLTMLFSLLMESMNVRMSLDFFLYSKPYTLRPMSRLFCSVDQALTSRTHSRLVQASTLISLKTEMISLDT